MSRTYMQAVKMRTSLVCAGLLLAAVGTAAAQDDFPKVETSPGFMFMTTEPSFGGSKSGGCAGIGGTIAYNVTSLVGLAADLGTCKVFGLDNTYGIGSKVGGSESTFLFGPRFTIRNKSPFRPFFELNIGAVRAKVSCNSGDFGNACNSTVVNPLIVVANPGNTSASKSAFGLSVGGGFDLRLSKKVSWRVVQAEYLYSRFGNDCQLAYCSNNNNQNSFRLKSALVVGWGGAQ